MKNILEMIEKEFGSLQEARIELINDSIKILEFLFKNPKSKEKVFIKYR
ncbi:MAG: hypothetical protein K2P17_00360 [Helicobacteraceae bacterium]|nr:hypothetical protein [Helicobacteraceae bacterium]